LWFQLFLVWDFLKEVVVVAPFEEERTLSWVALNVEADPEVS
jgi:hypothetical protein